MLSVSELLFSTIQFLELNVKVWFFLTYIIYIYIENTYQECPQIKKELKFSLLKGKECLLEIGSVHY